MVDCVAIFVAAVYCTAIGYTARGVCSITVVVVVVVVVAVVFLMVCCCYFAVYVGDVVYVGLL